MSEINELENIVRNALAESKRLDKEEARKEKEQKDAATSAAKANEKVDEKEDEESFDCPECGAKLKGNQKFCVECGCECEWSEE